jgi:hypothetical protein
MRIKHCLNARWNGSTFLLNPFLPELYRQIKSRWDARNETSVEGPPTIKFDNNGIWHLAVNSLSQS